MGAKKNAAKKSEARKKSEQKKKLESKKRVLKKKAGATSIPTEAVASSTAGNAVGVATIVQVSPRERYEMIATMAYYRAEKRNFEAGNDMADWLECESMVDQMLAK